MTSKSWEDMSFDELYDHINKPENRGKGIPDGKANGPNPGAPGFEWDQEWLDWDDNEPPPQEWTVPNRIPAKQVCLFSGHGGTGKSTIGLHLCAAHVLARDWIGTLPEPGPAFFIDAEDDLSVIRRRLWYVLRYYGQDTSFRHLHEQMRILSLAGKDSVLATVDRGKVVPSPLFNWLRKEAASVRPKQIVIASAANVCTCKESDRSEVGQFIHLLTGLAVDSGGSVILIAHPSLAGMATNTGLSGSTQWHNAVRARMYLKRPNADEQEPGDENSTLRKLAWPKNQYGAEAPEDQLEWRNGMFLPVKSLTEFEKAARYAKAEDAIRAALATGANFCPNPFARNYLPKVLSQNGAGKRADIEVAMKQMMEKGTLRRVQYGSPSHDRWKLVLE